MVRFLLMSRNRDPYRETSRDQRVHLISFKRQANGTWSSLQKINLKNKYRPLAADFIQNYVNSPHPAFRLSHGEYFLNTLNSSNIFRKH